MNPQSGAELCAIRLVVFDLGRVLVRICDNWAEACACAGISDANSNDLAGLIQLRELALRQEVGKLGPAGFAEAAASLMGLTAQQVRAASEAYIRGAYPGSIELVEELRGAGVATACLSNTNEHHWQIMTTPGHAAFFPLARLTHRFASHLIGARKPEAPIYEHLERGAGVPPASILFFDDVEENVGGARSRGWNARRIDPALDDPVGQMRQTLRRYRVLGG